jgi:hypothetical protein
MKDPFILDPGVIPTPAQCDVSIHETAAQLFSEPVPSEEFTTEADWCVRPGDAFLGPPFRGPISDSTWRTEVDKAKWSLAAEPHLFGPNSIQLVTAKQPYDKALILAQVVLVWESQSSLLAIRPFLLSCFARSRPGQPWTTCAEKRRGSLLEKSREIAAGVSAAIARQ